MKARVIASASSIALLVGCGTILGIEPLGVRPSADAGAPDAASDASGEPDGGDASGDSGSSSDAGDARDADGATPTDGTETGSGSVHVTGQIVDRNGEGVPGASIAVGNARATSGADGSFTLDVARSPYDVLVGLPAASSAYAFQGLTRADPTLQLAHVARPNQATVSGTLTGTLLPLAAGQRVLLMIDGPGGTSAREIPPGQGATFASHEHRWGGPSAIATEIHALLVEDASGVVASVPAHAHGPLSLTAGGGVATAPALPLSPGTGGTGHVSGTAAASVQYLEVHVGFGGGGAVRLSHREGAAGAFDVAVPDLPGAQIHVSAGRSGPGVAATIAHGSALAPGVTNLAFDLPAALAVTSPAPDAVVSHDTVWRWASASPAVCALRVQSGAVDYVVVSAASEVQIPNFSAVDLEVAGQRDAVATVTCYGPFSDLDAATSPAGFLDDYAAAFDRLAPYVRPPARAGTVQITDDLAVVLDLPP